MSDQRGAEFLGWVEDFSELLPNIKARTWAIVKGQNEKAWVINVQTTPPGAIPKDTYITATIEGEIYEIQGVVTILDLKSLVKDPWNTLFALRGKNPSLLMSTIKDIFFLEEMSEFRQSDLIEKLIKSEPIPEKAANVVLRFFKDNISLPMNPGTNKSHIMMIKEDPLATGNDKLDALSGKIYTDRMVIEDNLDRETQIRPFEELGANFKNQAIVLNSNLLRSEAKNAVLQSSFRGVASSYYGNLDKILDTFGPGTIATRKMRAGSFHTFLAKNKLNIQAHDGDISFLLDDDNNLREILGIPAGRTKVFTGMEKAFLKKWLKAEEYQLRFKFFKQQPPYLQNGVQLATIWEANGLSPTYQGYTPYHNNNVAPLSATNPTPLTAAKAASPDRKTLPVPDQISITKNLLKSGSLQGNIREFNNEITMDAENFVVINRAELLADISNHISDSTLQNDQVAKELRDFYVKKYTEYKNAGYSDTDAADLARAKRDDHAISISDRITGRTTDIILASRYSEKLHITEVYRDVFKAVQSGNFLNVLLSTRMISDVVVKPVFGKSLPSYTEAVAPADISKFKLFPIVNKIPIIKNFDPAKPSVKALMSTITIHKDPMAFPVVYILSSLSTTNKPKEELLGMLLQDAKNPLLKNKWIKHAFKDGKILIEIPTKYSQIKNQAMPLALKPLKFIPGIRNLETPYSYAVVRNDMFDGIFGEYAVYDVLETVYGNKNLFRAFNIAEFRGISATEMFANVTSAVSSSGQIPHLFNLYEKLKQVEAAMDTFGIAQTLAGTGGVVFPLAGAMINEALVPTHLLPYFRLSVKLGLINFDETTNIFSKVARVDDNKLIYAFGTLKENFEKFFTDGKGKALFDFLEKMGMDPDSRWHFLRGMQISGLSEQLKQFTGIFEWYNKYANLIQKWFIKNVVFNPHVHKVPVFGKLILRPLQNLIRRLGFSDQLSILATVQKWKWVAGLESWGEALHALVTTGSLPASMAGRLGFISKGVVKVLSKFGPTKGLMTLLFKGIATASSAVTFGISVLVAAFGDAIWKFAINMVKFKPKEAFQQAGQSIKSTFITIFKITKYTMHTAFMISLTCFGCVFFIIISVFMLISGMFVTYDKYDEYTGPDANASLLLEVTKSGVYDRATDQISYTISIRNPTTNDVTIASFQDNLTFTYPCSVSKGTINYGDPDFIGTLENPEEIAKDSPAIVGKVVPANGVMTVTFKLKGINAAKGSYTNEAVVTADVEPDKYARGIARTDVQEAGCFKCPEGWPSQTPLLPMQGPWAGYSHSKVEAIDLAPSDGGNRTVIATHSGTISVNAANTEIYGNNAIIVSTDGKYRTVYGHMVSTPNFSNGAKIEAGTVLGTMGTTGHSTGIHVHYEFGDIPYAGGHPKYQCIAGQPLKMKQVQGRSYLPRTIPDGCSDSTSCGGIIN